MAPFKNYDAKFASNAKKIVPNSTKIVLNL